MTETKQIGNHHKGLILAGKFPSKSQGDERALWARKLMGDSPEEECGIFGVYYPGEMVANLTYFGLYALQHRGQESAGIAVSDGTKILCRKEMGLVSQVFDQESIDSLVGEFAIGHTRYSTTGSAEFANAQPLRVVHPVVGEIWMAHNGNLVNLQGTRERLEKEGVVFSASSDTEVLGELIAQTPGTNLEEVLELALAQVEGAYCLLFLSLDKLVAVRDPLGIRPLCLGHFGDGEGGKGFVVASESCALDVTGADYIREIEPGEMISIEGSGLSSRKMAHATKEKAMCSFEFIYFARPDSVMGGRSVYESRRQMGMELAKESPAEGDIVISVPDSGTPAAVGYAEAVNLPFTEGMIKSRYITRTFIEPTQRLRDTGVKLKFNPMREILEGKRVILVDDSIVRGTTSSKLIEMIRKAGATEVHMRIASPPMGWPCFLGIDVASKRELIAADHSQEEIGRILGADSLRYLSLAGLRRALNQPDGKGFCVGCFTGNYPVAGMAAMVADKFALKQLPMLALV